MIQTKKLGSLCNIQIGRTPSRSNAAYWGKGLPWLSIADMNQGSELFSTKEQITSQAIEECRCRIVQSGTLLLSFKLSIGKRGFARIPMATNEAIVALPIINEKELDPRFLYYALPISLQNIPANYAAKGKTLNSKSLAELKIPLPPLEAQKRIAAILDKADEMRKKRKKSIQLLDNFLKSTFLDMFWHNKDLNNWEIETIENLAEEKKGSMRTGPFGSNLRHGEFVDSGIAVLGIDNAVDNTFKWKRRRFITEEKYQQLKRYTIFPKDVIITIMGTIGRTAVIPTNIQTCINTKHLAAITLNKKKASPLFIAHALRLHPNLQQQIALKNKGIIMDGLNLTIIKSLSFQLPPISLQNKFAEIVKKTEAIKEKYLRSSQELDNLFNSLVQKAFKG